MIGMMIFLHLVILLTIGFGVGYWLLITANKHEGRLKTIGESLGYVLLVLVILSSIFGFFASMKIDDSDYMPSMRQGDMQKLYREENENNETNPMMNNESSQESGEMKEAPEEGESGSNSNKN